jgi:hypothetical protein
MTLPPAVILMLFSRSMTRGSRWICRMRHAGTLSERFYYGHDGLRTFYREWNDAWEIVQSDVEELIDAGERVIDCDHPEGVDGRAGPRSNCTSAAFGRSARARSSGWNGWTRRARKPSKPPGCGSRAQSYCRCFVGV